jgi:transcriptional regulator with XRE-family HTH domain
MLEKKSMVVPKKGVLMVINEAIRKMRLSRGVPQSKLAESIGVSREFITQVEQGQKNLSAERLIQVADALECSLDELTGREPTKD